MSPCISFHWVKVRRLSTCDPDDVLHKTRTLSHYNVCLITNMALCLQWLLISHQSTSIWLDCTAKTDAQMVMINSQKRRSLVRELTGASAFIKSITWGVLSEGRWHNIFLLHGKSPVKAHSKTLSGGLLFWWVPLFCCKFTTYWWCPLSSYLSVSR